LSDSPSIIIGQLDRAARDNDRSGVATLSKRALEVLEAMGRITGEVSAITSQTLNVVNNTQILNSPPVLALESGLLEICREHPEVQTKIVALLKSLDAQQMDAPIGSQIIDAKPVYDSAARSVAIKAGQAKKQALIAGGMSPEDAAVQCAAERMSNVLKSDRDEVRAKRSAVAKASWELRKAPLFPGAPLRTGGGRHVP
jgi:hypothetical protein